MTDLLLLFIVLLVVFNGGWRRDETDSAKERSGLVLYTDYGTGCQYVGTELEGRAWQ